MIWALLGCVTIDLWQGERAVQEGRLDLAEAAFRRALMRDPENAEAMYGIGWTWHMAGDRDQAREAFRLLTEVHPQSPLGWKGLGSVWMANGNAVEARKAFENALTYADAEQTLAIRHSLALLELQGGDGNAALAGFDALVQQEGRGEFHQGRAEALLLLRRSEEALGASDQAVRGLSGHAQALARLTRARALLAVSADRVDPTRCAQTAPAVYAWLDAADHELDQAEATSPPPNVTPIRLLTRSRRSTVDDQCPGLRSPDLGK